MNTVNEVKALKPHIAINVSNIGASVEFYKKLFGIEPAKFLQSQTKHETTPGRPRGYAKFDVSNPPLNFTLNEHEGRDASSVSHLGIQVPSTEDVIAIRDRWVSTGLAVRDEMRVDCCYALQDKSWTVDPDGNAWEVFTVLEDTESAANCCGTAEDVGIVGIVDEACCHAGGIANNINHSKTV